MQSMSTLSIILKDREGRILMNSQPKILAPYKPTPQFVVENMLRLAQLKKDDILFDLGCGDGRILVTAAKKYGVKCIGVDIDPECIEKALMNVKKARVENLVTVYIQDVMITDFSMASVVTLYLLPDGNMEVQKLIRKQLKVGSRVISHDYWMEDWPPWRVEIIREYPDIEHLIYLWKI